MKFRAKVSGDYLGASIILASVYLSISSRLCCRELTRLSVIRLGGVTQASQRKQPPLPCWIPSRIQPGASPGASPGPRVRGVDPPPRQGGGEAP